MKSHIKEHLPIYLILLLGLCLRLVYIWEYSQLPEWTQLTVDNNFHHYWALTIADGNLLGDTTYFRAPFYIYYLAAVYKLFGVSLWAVRLFGVLPGLLSIYITYLIGKYVYNKHTGLIAGTLHAIFPIIYYFESELLLDSLFMLLFQLAIYFYIKWWKEDSSKILFYSGFFFSLASITRPTALVIALFCLVIIFVLKRYKLKQVLLFTLGLTLCIAPVFIRNIVVAGDAVLIASQGGINLYVGNNDAADGLSAVLPAPLGYNWHIKQISYIAEKESHRKLSAIEISSFWAVKAFQWIQENPSRFLQLYTEKLYHNISNRKISNNRYLKQFFNKITVLKYNYLSFGILFCLSITSLLLTRRENKQALFIGSIIILYILLTSLFFFSSRFRLPLIPLYLILSAHTLLALRVLFKKNRKHASIILGVTILFGLFSYYPVVTIPQGSASLLYTSQGLYYSAMGEQKQALALFKKANACEPDMPEGNLNIGATYLKLGQTDSALHYINREKMLHPLQSKGFTNAASIYYNLGMYDSALVQINKSLELEPYKVIANQLLGRIIFHLNHSIFEIQKQIIDIRKRTGDNIYILNDLATSIYNDPSIQNSLAISILHDAVESTPPAIETDDASFMHLSPNTTILWNKQRALSYYHLGYISGITGKFNDAIRYSNSSIAIDSSLADAYLNLVSGYFSTNQKENGLQVLKIALEKFPHHKNLQQIENILQQ